MKDQRWQVISIDLHECDPRDQAPTLACPAGYAGLRAVFFWDGVPLGHALISATELPLTRDQLLVIASRAVTQTIGCYTHREGFTAALPRMPEPTVQDPSRALHQLTAPRRLFAELATEFRGFSASNDAPRPTLTIAIPTRERPQDLARCLRALQQLEDAPDEILVIDNNPVTNATADVVRRFPNVRYHRENQPGLSAARNAALQQATSDIVAFTDDDVCVHPGWTSALRRSFSDPQTMLVTGLVLPGELETHAQYVFEEDLSFFHQGYRPRRFDAGYFEALRDQGVPVWSLGAGANMAIRRSVYEQGHRFDTRLGPGVFGGCGEDSEFWYGILARGGVILYEPSACVFHYHRRQLADLRKLMREYMKGHVAALILQYMKYGDAGNLRRLFLRLPAEYGIVLLRLIVSGFATSYRVLLHGILGSLAGLRFAWRRSETPSQAN